jgi:protein-export membrane protein SecD
VTRDTPIGRIGASLLAAIALAAFACAPSPDARSTAEDAFAPGGVKLVYEIDAERSAEAAPPAAETVDVILRRLDALDLDGVAVAERDDGRIQVRVERDEAVGRVKDVIGARGELTFQVVASDDPGDIQRARDGVPPASQALLPTRDPSEPYLLVFRRLDAADTAAGPDGEPVGVLSGALLRDASRGVHFRTGDPVVNFRFDATGADIFGKVTANHIRERFAVVLDGRIVMAPIIASPIPGGEGFIEGGLTTEEAEELAAVLNAGALPAPLLLIEERGDDISPSEGSVTRLRFAALGGAAALEDG